MSRGVLAYRVSVDAQLAGDRPTGESPELGLLHILPKSTLASGGFFVLSRSGFARPQVAVHLACFQCRQVGVASVSSAVDAAGQRGLSVEAAVASRSRLRLGGASCVGTVCPWCCTRTGHPSPPVSQPAPRRKSNESRRAAVAGCAGCI